MKAVKILTALILSVALALSCSLTAHAGSYDALQYSNEAYALYQLGLFRGREKYANGFPNFDLDSGTTRVEGLVMLIRLLGEEDEALAYEGTCPFTDVPDWAIKYVSYAYNKGYTKGTSATTFGTDQGLFGLSYITFILRALGYDDDRGDFTYEDADRFAANIGLDCLGCGGYLSRDLCAKVSYSALNTRLKDSRQTLAEKLIADGTLTEEAVLRSGALDENGECAPTAKPTQPVQYWSEEESIRYLLLTLPDTTYAYDLEDFKEKLAELSALGGSVYYPDEYEEIDLNREYTNYSHFDNHTNAEARQFIADYVANFDPAFLFADQFPEAPADWRHDVEIYGSTDYNYKGGASIALGREFWEENLNILRFSAILSATPGHMRSRVRDWQMGKMSDAALKNHFDQWIAVGGVYKNFKISVQ